MSEAPNHSDPPGAFDPTGAGRRPAGRLARPALGLARHRFEKGPRTRDHPNEKLFVRTLRDDPADAEIPSHRFLVRAGYIRRVAPGVYAWLPLGLRVLSRVEAIVREEMDAIGAQEVRLPVLLPREPYETTGRWTEYGPNLFRLVDRRGADMLLSLIHI